MHGTMHAASDVAVDVACVAVIMTRVCQAGLRRTSARAVRLMVCTVLVLEKRLVQLESGELPTGRGV